MSVTVSGSVHLNKAGQQSHVVYRFITYAVINEYPSQYIDANVLTLQVPERHINRVYSANVSKQSLCLHGQSAHIMHLTAKFAHYTSTDSTQ